MDDQSQIQSEISKTLPPASILATLKHIFETPLYLFLAIDGAFALGVLYWWLLAQKTTWVTFYSMYGGVPLYFWPYVILTLVAMILFGMSSAVAVYSWRHSQLKNIKSQGSTAFGAFFGALGAACPVCGAFLLSALGITGGVAILPFQGLELKLLSVGFFGAALFFSTKKLSHAVACEACEVALTPQVKEKDSTFSYQALLAVFFITLLFALPLWKQEQVAASVVAKSGKLTMNKIQDIQKTNTGNTLYNEVVAKALPTQGFKTRIVLGDAVVKLVNAGVIDLEKFKELYSKRGMSEKELAILTRPSSEPITIDADNAGLLLNLFWPLGLANKTEFNKSSPVNGESLFNFASTGGWTLGKEDNGGKYFNKYEIVKLTSEQETIALEVAQNTYRPCCNNSSFFQDCNHGSALLGVIELGASQGLTKEELYKVALEFNSFWFSQTYIQTALYYKIAKNTDWENVDPKEIMSINFSSASGWGENIGRPFQEIAKKNPNLLPQRQNRQGCGV